MVSYLSDLLRLSNRCHLNVLTTVALCCSLLEMMLESSLSDLREAQGVVLPFCPSLVRLLRLLQDFLFAEGTDNHALWSEKVRHGVPRHAAVCLIPRLALRNGDATHMSPRSKIEKISDAASPPRLSCRKSFNSCL